MSKCSASDWCWAQTNSCRILHQRRDVGYLKTSRISSLQPVRFFLAQVSEIIIYPRLNYEFDKRNGRRELFLIFCRPPFFFLFRSRITGSIFFHLWKLFHSQSDYARHIPPDKASNLSSGCFLTRLYRTSESASVMFSVLTTCKISFRRIRTRFRLCWTL